MKNGHHFEYKPIRVKNLKEVNRRLERINDRQWTRIIVFVVIMLLIACVWLKDQIDAADPEKQAITILLVISSIGIVYFINWIKKQRG